MRVAASEAEIRAIIDAAKAVCASDRLETSRDEETAKMLKDNGTMERARNSAEIVRSYFKAYPDKDRAAIEVVVAEDFHFTSPLDNRIDRQTYFDRCWPNSETPAALDREHVVVSGEKVFVTYAMRMDDGRRSRNTELLTVRDGQIADVEVFFGWSIPHKASPGGFVPEKQ